MASGGFGGQFAEAHATRPRPDLGVRRGSERGRSVQHGRRGIHGGRGAEVDRVRRSAVGPLLFEGWPIPADTRPDSKVGVTSSLWRPIRAKGGRQDSTLVLKFRPVLFLRKAKRCRSTPWRGHSEPFPLPPDTCLGASSECQLSFRNLYARWPNPHALAPLELGAYVASARSACPISIPVESGGCAAVSGPFHPNAPVTADTMSNSSLYTLPRGRALRPCH